MSEGTLRLERVWGGMGFGAQHEGWQIEVDSAPAAPLPTAPWLSPAA